MDQVGAFIEQPQEFGVDLVDLVSDLLKRMFCFHLYSSCLSPSMGKPGSAASSVTLSDVTFSDGGSAGGSLFVSLSLLVSLKSFPGSGSFVASVVPFGSRILRSSNAFFSSSKLLI